MIKVDYIIVGQGIAGSMVAHFLLEKNKKVFVIDQSCPNSASNIASGVVNPITGRRIVKTWMIDDILPFVKVIYRQIENKLNASFFFEQEIYKLFTSKDDVSIWCKKKNDRDYSEYLGDIIDLNEKKILTPFGAGIIRKGCWMDVPGFIKTYRNYLFKNNYLLEEKFEIHNLLISDTISYKNIIADKIIFCEGYKAHLNPFFSFIPFSFAKGEYISIHSKDLQSSKILNKNIYIIPKGNDIYNVGSTFSWDDLEETITETGKAEICQKLEKIISCPYTIIEEKAGIRPTIIDRRPVIGVHPNHPNLYIFNGLGTKGVSLAPYFANHFVSHLINNEMILDEISVSRFVL